jgi:CubicO group peptidase (beta-lactamase class C family)
VVATLLLGGAFACRQAVPPRPTLDVEGPVVRAVLEDFAQRLQDDVSTDGIGSMAVAVFQGNTVLWTRAFGLADAEREIAATPHTIYRIGSISKTVTAALLLQLVDRGVVNLDDSLSQHLPEITGVNGDSTPASPQGDSVQARGITFRQLASHTSGLDREPGLDDAATGPIEGWEDKILASIPRTLLERDPGAAYAYSNIGYGILGLALSRAAGEPFMALVEEGIFEPLGMTSSTFVIGEGMAPRLAVGYRNSRDGAVDTGRPAREHTGRGYKVPNGGVYSTVGNLARFAAAVMGATDPQLLSDESRAEMLRIQTPEDSTRGYGLGVVLLESEDGVRMAGHGGSVAGYTAYLAFEVESRIGVALLRNYNRGATTLGETASELVMDLRMLAR